MACQVRWEGAQRRAGPCLDAETERGRQAVEPIAKVSTDSPCGSDTSEYPRWAQKPTPVVIGAPQGEARGPEKTRGLVESYEASRGDPRDL